VGATAAALGGPVAGERFGQGASSCLGVIKRLVLEIAGRRIDPRLVPGIAAMRTDSPLAAFLAHPETRRRDGIRMAVIAGDTEFEGFGLSDLRRRVASLFCDWRLFDRNDNDLVVDTDSMYAGLGFRAGAKYLYDQDDSVTHFRYFRNAASRDALGAWLVEEEPERLTQFLPLTTGGKLPWKDRDARQIRRGADRGPRPVAILIPGIMGSHIEIDRRDPKKAGTGNRVWFDPASLFLGRLADIGDPDADNAAVEDLFEMFYGDLADHLARTHAVIRCPYDWRQPLDKCAEALKEKIEAAARSHPGQPIRLLAHSMGGLVARALMHHHGDAWKAVTDSGGRLVMLGTPNNGSHLMVHTLLGKSGAMRKLEMLDRNHGMQGILDIVAGFPGALALLPRPGFADTGQGPGVITSAEYYLEKTWHELRKSNTDRWYGEGIGGEPKRGLLEEAGRIWRGLPADLADPPGRVAYVHGQSDKTPCGVQRDGKGRLKLLFTPCGDGSVTWQSGRIDGLDEHSWYMPVEHADLTGEEDYFPAIVELLEKGATDKLGRLPRARGDAAATFTLEAEPPVLADEEELARAFMGSGAKRRKSSQGRRALRVSVRAGDVRFLDQPVLCGHYIGDAISGAEGALDELLHGALSERERMGVYASEIGTSAIVLRPPSGEEQARGSLTGAVIVGLGAFTGQLSARQVSETVRAAVMRLLLQLRDAMGYPPETPVQLHSVLIGWGSTSSISVAESVTAITRGVLEANRQFGDATGKAREQNLAVTELCFIELYRDAAVSAAWAVLELPEQMSGELKRLGMRIEAASSLATGEGALERLNVASDLGHWSRLIISDADAPDIECPSECYEVRRASPIPPDIQRRLCKQARCEEDAQEEVEGNAAGIARPGAAASGKSDAENPCAASNIETRHYPQRLKYLFLSQRARAETVWQRRQPGLVEEIIRAQRHNPAYDAKLGHTLFQLMVPVDYKAAARDQARLLLVLDGYTANLPWELMQADGEPLVLRIPMVRQLTTSRYRPAVRTANINSACIIVNPSTYGFCKRFPGDREKLDDLPGSVREGDAIAASLRRADWSDITLTAPDREALDIFNTLHDHPYRVLMIGAHGIFEAKARDGNVYSGVVLSGGLLITAVEISQMEVVPELVFLSCCHLGSISNPYSQPNRLAYSLARELIEMGVRCVVAAGWEVNDDAACTFAGTFFDRLTRGQTFGDAIFAARKAAHQQHPASNTWGAYQAYGDPGYRLRPGGDDDSTGAGRPYVAVEQLLAAIRRRRIDDKRIRAGGNPPNFSQQNQWARRQLAKCPVEWAERADVLQALAELYGDTGTEGFEAARSAYLRAVQLEDGSGRVAVRAIEQLANMEARHGEILDETGNQEEALKHIDSACRRLKALAESVGSGETGKKDEKNTERAGILGSALKLKAAVLARRAGTWDMTAEVGKDRPPESVPGLLAQAATAYQSGIRGDWAKDPYNTLNALPLAWLAGTLSETFPGRQVDPIALARSCGEEARRHYARGKGFWSAVTAVDADMIAWLLGRDTGDPVASLRRRYDEAVDKVPKSAREWESVVKQWRLLARFLRLRGKGDDALRAGYLETLASHYWRAAPPSAPADEAPPSPPGDSPPEKTRKPRSRKQS
jgi:CHAT domain-containing protein